MTSPGIFFVKRSKTVAVIVLRFIQYFFRMGSLKIFTDSTLKL